MAMELFSFSFLQNRSTPIVDYLILQNVKEKEEEM